MKYEGTKITFKSIADLGKERGLTLSTLALIKSLVESNINSNGKKQVRY